MANSNFSLWINDQLLSFDPEIDRLLTFSEGRLKVRLQIHKGYDVSQLQLMIGGEPPLPGYMMHFYQNSQGELIVEEGDLTQLAGQKLFGITSIELLYRGKPLVEGFTQVHFEPTATVKQQASFMLDYLQKINASILDFYGLSKQSFNTDMDSRLTEFDWDIEEFLLLYQFYKQSCSFLYAGIEMLDYELVVDNDQPAIPIHQAHPLTNEVLASSYRRKGAFSNKPYGTMTVPLPLMVSRTQRVVSYNTKTNQKALMILKEIRRDTARIKNSINDEMMRKSDLRDSLYGGYATYTDFKLHRLGAAWQTCQEILVCTNQWIRLLTQLGVRISNDNIRSVKSIKHIYRGLFNNFREYKAKVTRVLELININDNSFPLQTHSINSLYEIWATNTIARVMVQKLGFKLMNNSSFNESEVLPLLKSGQTLEMLSPIGQKVLFHYDKKYPSLDNPFCMETLGFVAVPVAGFNRVSKNNPDIAIEFYSGIQNPPSIIIFDSTFSNDPAIHQQKSFYEETIRYRTSIDSPRKEWDLPVRQALAVHPFPSADGLIRKHEVVLVPDDTAEEQAMVWLRRIFSRERLI